MTTGYRHGAEPYSDLAVQLVLNDRTDQLRACWTTGMDDYGFPELVLINYLADEEDDLDAARDDLDHHEDLADPGELAHQAIRFAQMVVLLGRDVLASDCLDVPPRHQPVMGMSARFWLGDPQERPLELAAALPDSRIVIPVHWVIG